MGQRWGRAESGTGTCGSVAAPLAFLRLICRVKHLRSIRFVASWDVQS